MEISWEQRRGQIKHQLYTLALLTDMDKSVLGEMFKALNEVAPVVRCKDCVYWEQAKADSGSCNRAFEITAYASDYCSYGERKDEVEECLKHID